MCDENELYHKMIESIEFWTEACKETYYELLLELVDLGMDVDRAILILKDAYEAADGQWEDNGSN